MSKDAPADPLELESLDTDSLLAALAAVEKAVPDLLLGVKPVLAHLSAPTASADADERTGVPAREAVENYMNTLDKIQFILRQTVYYLRETRAAPSALRPPPADGLPRPLAATLRTTTDASAPNTTPAGGADATLGLYGARQEVAALKGMLGALRTVRREVAEGGGLVVPAAAGGAVGEGEGGDGDGDGAALDSLLGGEDERIELDE